MSILKSFIDKSISLLYMGNDWISSLCADISEAARTVSYIETVGNKADTFHKHIANSDERYIKKAFESGLRAILKKHKIKKVTLAIDGKKDLYYGKNGSLFVRNIAHEHGAEQAWEYIVLSIVYPVRIPVMAVRYHQGADLAKCCIELLDYAKTLPIKITKVLFDRGFYNAHLIDYLESKKTKKPIPYLIFVPKNEVIKRMIANTKGKFGFYQHQMLYNQKKSTWRPSTIIVICKEVGVDKKGQPYDWVFATNLKPSYGLVKEYRKRWNIETGFRIMEQGKILTKSNEPLTRFFYFILRALITVIWAVNNICHIYMTFKRYLRNVEYECRKKEAYKPPPISPIY